MLNRWNFLKTGFYEGIKLGPNAEAARELAGPPLSHVCDQKNRSQEALGYNALVQSWPEVARLAQQVVRPTQGRMGLHTMTAETIISTMVDRIVGRFQPSRVVLFGSQARGDAQRVERRGPACRDAERH